MFILECSQECYEGRTDRSVTISIRNFVGEGIISMPHMQVTYNFKASPLISPWSLNSIWSLISTNPYAYLFVITCNYKCWQSRNTPILYICQKDNATKNITFRTFTIIQKQCISNNSVFRVILLFANQYDIKFHKISKF